MFDCVLFCPQLVKWMIFIFVPNIKKWLHCYLRCIFPDLSVVNLIIVLLHITFQFINSLFYAIHPGFTSMIVFFYFQNFNRLICISICPLIKVWLLFFIMFCPFITDVILVFEKLIVQALFFPLHNGLVPVVQLSVKISPAQVRCFHFSPAGFLLWASG